MKTLAPVIFFLLLSACASDDAFRRAVTETDKAYARLKQGDDAAASGNYTEAEQIYDAVKSEYPYSDAAKDAELHFADMDFDRGQFAAARERYQQFARLHPMHPKVDHAAFRAALSHVREIGSDFFLLPPVREKEQAPVRAARAAMRNFLQAYPSSAHVAEARRWANDMESRMADHEAYVAEFYARRERWSAAAARWEGLIKTYPETQVATNSKQRLAHAYRKLGRASDAEHLLTTGTLPAPARPAEKAHDNETKAGD